MKNQPTLGMLIVIIFEQVLEQTGDAELAAEYAAGEASQVLVSPPGDALDHARRSGELIDLSVTPEA